MDPGGGDPGPGPGTALDGVAVSLLAAAQPTDVGREIHRLAVFGGRLYIAFGDYTGNTGPIRLAGLTLATQTGNPVEVTLHAEETWTMRVIDGTLYVPFADPQGSNANPENGQYAAAATPGAWTVATSVPDATHVFDMAETVDGRWLFGSVEGVAHEATIWRTVDDGVTWTKALQAGGATGFDRFYACAQFGDTLLAFLSSPGGDQVWRWDDGSTEWADVTDDVTIPGAVAPTDGAAFIYDHSGTDVPYYIGALDRKDTGSVNPWAALLVLLPEDETHRAAVVAALPDPNTTYLDACTDPATGDQYLLAGGLSPLGVWRSVDHGPFTLLLDLDNPANSTVRCMTVGGDGYLYFGTTDSRILRTATPA